MSYPYPIYQGADAVIYLIMERLRRYAQQIAAPLHQVASIKIRPVGGGRQPDLFGQFDAPAFQSPGEFHAVRNAAGVSPAPSVVVSGFTSAVAGTVLRPDSVVYTMAGPGPFAVWIEHRTGLEILAPAGGKTLPAFMEALLDTLERTRQVLGARRKEQTAGGGDPHVTATHLRLEIRKIIDAREVSQTLISRADIEKPIERAAIKKGLESLSREDGPCPTPVSSGAG